MEKKGTSLHHTSKHLGNARAHIFRWLAPKNMMNNTLSFSQVSCVSSAAAQMTSWKNGSAHLAVPFSSKHLLNAGMTASRIKRLARCLSAALDLHVCPKAGSWSEGKVA
jgi:hypothetical protein